MWVGRNGSGWACRGGGRKAPRSAPCAARTADPVSGAPVSRYPHLGGMRALAPPNGTALVDGTALVERVISLRKKLGCGDRRSIGRVPAVVRQVTRSPALVSELVDALADSDAVVRMRAADALEKLTAARPDLARGFTSHLVRVAATADQQEVRWHIAQIMPRLPLTARQRARCARAFRVYLRDKSSIVRTCALDALAELAAADPRLRWEVEALLEEALRVGTSAMRARARRILARRRASKQARGKAFRGRPNGAPRRGSNER